MELRREEKLQRHIAVSVINKFKQVSQQLVTYLIETASDRWAKDHPDTRERLQDTL